MNKNSLKVGDLITSYHTGVFKVTKIEPFYYSKESEIPSFLKDSKKVGDLSRTLVTYSKICNLEGVVTTQKEYQCDIAYCYNVDEYIDREIKRIKKLKSIVKNERDSV